VLRASRGWTEVNTDGGRRRRLSKPPAPERCADDADEVSASTELAILDLV